MINTPLQNILGFTPEGLNPKNIETKKAVKPSIFSKILGIDVSVKKNTYGIGHYVKLLGNKIVNLFKKKPTPIPVITELNGIPIKRIKQIMYYKFPTHTVLSQEENDKRLQLSAQIWNTISKAPSDINFDVIDIHNEYRELNEKDLNQIKHENLVDGEKLLKSQHPDNPERNFMIHYKPKAVKKINENLG